MDGADDEIQAPQHRVRQVQRAIFENVDLNALEQHRPPFVFGVETIDGVRLRGQAFCCQSMGDGNARRVIGNCQVLKASLACLFCHGFQAGGSIAGSCMDMKIALDVVFFQEGR